MSNIMNMNNSQEVNKVSEFIEKIFIKNLVYILPEEHLNLIQYFSGEWEIYKTFLKSSDTTERTYDQFFMKNNEFNKRLINGFLQQKEINVINYPLEINSCKNSNFKGKNFSFDLQAESESFRKKNNKKNLTIDYTAHHSFFIEDYNKNEKKTFVKNKFLNSRKEVLKSCEKTNQRENNLKMTKNLLKMFEINNNKQLNIFLKSNKKNKTNFIPNKDDSVDLTSKNFQRNL